MEFVRFDEIWPELKARGVIERPLTVGNAAEGGLTAFDLHIEPARHPARVTIGGEDTRRSGSAPTLHSAIPCSPERMAFVLETILHKLHLAPLFVIPVGRWREIFDVISFSLAAHDAWQEVDAQASLEQKTRDPLTCAPSDLHMLRELVRVLLAEGEPDAGQALTIIATGQLVVARVEPKRPIAIEVGSAIVADQLRDAAVHFLGGTNHA